MREAVGGSILFYIILGFIGVFIVFIAIIMNYASAYRTNNYVVNMIEQTEGRYTFGTENKSENSLVGYLLRNSYNNGLVVTCSENKNGAVYNVTTAIKFYIPLIDVGFPIKIVNDTKTIYGEWCTYNGEQSPSIGCWKGEANLC